jgi:hypothetical protein
LCGRWCRRACRAAAVERLVLTQDRLDGVGHLLRRRVRSPTASRLIFALPARSARAARAKRRARRRCCRSRARVVRGNSVEGPRRPRADRESRSRTRLDSCDGAVRRPGWGRSRRVIDGALNRRGQRVERSPIRPLRTGGRIRPARTLRTTFSQVSALASMRASATCRARARQSFSRSLWHVTQY